MNKKRFLKDDVASIILTSEECRDYLIAIVASALNIDANIIRNNLTMVSTHVNHNINLKNNIADAVFENDNSFINIEVNYNSGYKTDLKNMHYICHLILKQTDIGTPYKNIKHIYQININNYDYFHKNKFIYKSVLKEDSLNIIRNNFYTIIDINVDFLSKIDYNVIKNYDSNSLEKLLYLFICDNVKLFDHIYIGDEIMEKVKKKMTTLNEKDDWILYYDHEEFNKMVAYDKAVEEGMALGIKQGIEDGMRKGIEQGIEQGIEMKQKEIAINMLKENIDIQLISKITGLSDTVIKSLNEKTSD